MFGQSWPGDPPSPTPPMCDLKNKLWSPTSPGRGGGGGRTDSRRREAQGSPHDLLKFTQDGHPSSYLRPHRWTGLVLQSVDFRPNLAPQPTKLATLALVPASSMGCFWSEVFCSARTMTGSESSKKRMATACTIELRSKHVLARFRGKHKRARGYRK